MIRFQFLQRLIDTRGYTRYLEVGVAGGHTYTRIKCEHKRGCDIRKSHEPGFWRGTSDDFFAQNDEQFDLVFVDGWHQREQALLDVDNALACLRPGGLIVMHDCSPATAWRGSREPTPYGGWNGDVWKAFVELRGRPNLDCACGDFDQGCGVVVPRRNTARLKLPLPVADLEWADLDASRVDWLRLMPAEPLLEWIG